MCVVCTLVVPLSSLSMPHLTRPLGVIGSLHLSTASSILNDDKEREWKAVSFSGAIALKLTSGLAHDQHSGQRSSTMRSEHKPRGAANQFVMKRKLMLTTHHACALSCEALRLMLAIRRWGVPLRWEAGAFLAGCLLGGNPLALNLGDCPLGLRLHLLWPWQYIHTRPSGKTCLSSQVAPRFTVLYGIP